MGIVWLNRPPANPISPQVIKELTELWEEIDGKLRAVVFASSNVFTFCAGADIKEFTKMSPDKEGKELIDSAHAFMRGMEQSRTVTIAAVNSIAFGGGCELAMACDFRLAAESATFGQPEINLGIIPGFGGTQRLPRLVGEAKALEMNLVGDPIGAYEALRLGLANQVVPDHELFDTALAWAKKLAGQAPLAIEHIKRVSANGDLDAGHRGREGRASPRRSDRRTRRRGSGHSWASASRSSRASSPARGAAPRRPSAPSSSPGRASRCPPGFPISARPGTGLWENVDPMEVAHIDAWRRDPDRFWEFYGQRFASLIDTGPTARTRWSPSSSGAG